MAELSKVIEALSKDHNFASSSWQVVQSKACIYGRLKAFGTFLDSGGNSVRPFPSEAEGMLANMKDDLLRAVMSACAEEAHFGATVLNATNG